jgi:Mg2+/Co2+ transporter CorB
MNMWATQVQSLMTPRIDVSIMNSAEPVEDRMQRLTNAAQAKNRLRRAATERMVISAINARGSASTLELEDDLSLYHSYISEVCNRLMVVGKLTFQRGPAARKYWRLA